MDLMDFSVVVDFIDFSIRDFILFMEYRGLEVKEYLVFIFGGLNKFVYRLYILFEKGIGGFFEDFENCKNVFGVNYIFFKLFKMFF